MLLFYQTDPLLNETVFSFLQEVKKWRKKEKKKVKTLQGFKDRNTQDKYYWEV